MNTGRMNLSICHILDHENPTTVLENLYKTLGYKEVESNYTLESISVLYNV